MASSGFYTCKVCNQETILEWPMASFTGSVSPAGVLVLSRWPWQGLVNLRAGTMGLFHSMCHVHSWLHGGASSSRVRESHNAILWHLCHHWVKAVKKKAYLGLGECPWRESCERQPQWALPGLPGSTHMRGPHRLSRFWGGQSYSHPASAGWHQSPSAKSPFAAEEANCLATIQRHSQVY